MRHIFCGTHWRNKTEKKQNKIKMAQKRRIAKWRNLEQRMRYLEQRMNVECRRASLTKGQ